MKTPENSPTETTVTAKVTLGLDLGDRQHSYCVLDAEGEILAEDQLVNTRECLEALSRRYPNARMLAKLCRVDPILLSPVKHRSEACQQALVELKARDALVRTRVNLTSYNFI